MTLTARTLLAVLLLAVLAAPGLAQVGEGSVAVTCPQGRAAIIVDHQIVGYTPARVVLPAGLHELRVAIDDNYMPYQVTVEVVVGRDLPLVANLVRTAESLFAEGLQRLHGGDAAGATLCFDASAQAPGKRPAALPFYLGIVREKQTQYADAESDLTRFLQASDRSPTGHYHLGRVRQAMGQDAAAATEYKAALVRLAPSAAPIMAAAGPPTYQNLKRLRAVCGQPGHEADTLQLAYLLELKGEIREARDLYRALFDTLAAGYHIDVDQAMPPHTAIRFAGLPTLRPLPAEPAALLCVGSSDEAAVKQAWQSWVRQHPALSGITLASPPVRHWTALASRAFEAPATRDATRLAAQALSNQLRIGVVYLLITHDGRAWYYYYQDGHLLDQYCSDPGLPGQTDPLTLRHWQGKPDVLVGTCRGNGAFGPATISDLDRILYFYPPEMRSTKPAAYRSPARFMAALARLLGVPAAPIRFVRRAHQAGWSRW